MLFHKKNNGRKIGFVFQDSGTYYNAMASTRLRCFDIINFFKNDASYEVKKYSTNEKLELVIFQKCFDEKSYEQALQLKEGGTKIILDINVNYIEKEGDISDVVSDEQQNDIKKMLALTDCVITSSNKLKEIYSRHHKEVFCIEENVQNDFFDEHKQHRKNDEIKLVYCGYSAKAQELYLIEDVLKNLREKYKIKLLFISDQDPKIDIIPYEFIKYDQKKLPKQLLQGDIKLAPRDLNNSYNIGHSFTKVAYPMAVGLPAVASPQPSYINREVLICNDSKEWHDTLERLIMDCELRNYYGYRGQEFVKNNFSINKIGFEYKHLFDYILS
jgi:hypothetical protein